MEIPRLARRRLLGLPLCLALRPAAAAAIAPAAEARPGVKLVFPRDHGAHPDFRTEWWYLTAWAADGGGDMGLQVTFFRHRPGLQEDARSRFAPRQLLFAHAAVADPALGRLVHEQRAARAGFGLAEAGTEGTRLRMDDWSLDLEADRYRVRVPGRTLQLDLTCAAPGAPLLQGEGGYSRKGPDPRQASHYYSRPGLVLSGTVRAGGSVRRVRGLAWLDHEWSGGLLGPQAVGWDWTGLHLEDGAALTAFRVRDATGRSVWAGGSLRPAGGALVTFGPREVGFTPLRGWTSPRTGARWPVAMRVDTPAGSAVLAPLMDDQELDTRASTGTVYWEGAVRAGPPGTLAGRGYLELTGYERPLRL